MLRHVLILSVFVAAALIAPGSWTAARAQDTNAQEQPNRLIGYTAWDDSYLYVAVQVDKPTLKGANASPFSNPLEDDAVVIELQTDNSHDATQPTANTYVIAVSEAGGAQLYSGASRAPLFPSFQSFQDELQKILAIKDDKEREAQRSALLARILKFAVTQHGEKRATGTFRSGYTVEVGIPWVDLGGKPADGSRMGFNVAAQSTTPDSPAVESLSPLVTSPDQLFDPSLWSTVLFSANPAPSTAGQVTCPQVFTNTPVIDGTVSDGEWIGLSAFSVNPAETRIETVSLTHTLAARARPAFTPRPPATPPARIPSLPREVPVRPHVAQPLPRLVLATYLLAYQADPRKDAPQMGVLRGDGASALMHHPLTGTGPWFSYDRADWQVDELYAARQAGIDGLLVQVPSSPDARRRYVEKALIVMAEALRSMRRAGQEYPLVAPMIEVQPSSSADAEVLNAIRCFYLAIPASYRLAVPLSPQNGGGYAYPVFLSTGGSAVPPGLPFALREAALRELGVDLLLLADGGSMQSGLDGAFKPSRAEGFQMPGGGWIRVGSIGPGWLGQEFSANQPLLLRAGGDTYRAEWVRAIASSADWTLIGGWDDFGTGSEIAPSLESGYADSDLTREYTRQWLGLTPRKWRLLSASVPPAMAAGETFEAAVQVENTGTEGWGPPGAGVAVAAVRYIWRSGQSERGAGLVPIQTPIMPGHRAALRIPIRAASSTGQALPAGRYTLEMRVEFRDGRGRTDIAANADPPDDTLEIPVQIEAGGADEPWSLGVVSTDMPTMMESGSVYAIHARLQNEGLSTWPAGARASLRFYRMTPGTGSGTPVETAVPAADASSALTAAVAPGGAADVQVDVPLTTPAGAPLPAWTQGDPWSYTARWELTDDQGRGAAGTPETVAVVDMDFGARFVRDTTPSELPANHRLPIRLSLQNVGPQTWRAGAVRVGYHWYYEDGTEYVFDDETTPIPADVPPGGKTGDLLVWVTAPPDDGLYFLVWDLRVGDTWASTIAATAPGDEMVHPIRVINGRLTFVDLSKDFNLAGATQDGSPAQGDFDGHGLSFPASLMPPYAVSDLCPAGAFMAGGKPGPDSSRRISFRWPANTPGQKDFVECRGQRIELGADSAICAHLHVLAATTGADVSTNIKLIFQEPTEQSEDLYAFQASRWDQPQVHSTSTAFLAQRHNGPTGPAAGAVALYHYVIDVPEPRKLVAIQLPNEPRLKIAAITLER